MFLRMLSQIAILLVLVFIGILARFFKVFTEGITRDLHKLILSLTLPFLYFHVLTAKTSKSILFDCWYLPLLAIAIVFFGFFLSFACSAVFAIPNNRRKTFYYLSSFTNCGFLAIPLSLFLFGEEGVVRVVIFNLGFSILIWTLGVGILQERKKPADFFKNFFNPGTSALLLGFMIVGTGISLPFILEEAFGLVGGLTIPLAMLLVGAILSSGRGTRGKVDLTVILPLLLIRLVIVPGLALLLGKALSFSGLILGVFVLQAGMPSASTTPVFVQRFGGDTELAGSGVFFTHLFSVITLPFWISLT